MLIHQCEKCGKLVINRIAGDDEAGEVMKIFGKSKNLKLETIKNIRVVKGEDEKEVRAQLYGKGSFGKLRMTTERPN